MAKEKKPDEWGGYWNPEKKSFGKAIIDFMRKYYFNRAVVSIVGDVAGKTVLEAGCGTSESLVIMLDKKAKKTCGVDIAKGALKISEFNFKKSEISGDKYELKLGDINKIPYEDNTFDVVFNAGVIEHFTNTKPIKEMLRVAKPGGKVVILVPANGLYFYIFKILEKLVSKDEFAFEEHKFYDKKMMEQELLESGAKIIKVFRPMVSLGVHMAGVVTK